MITITCEMSFNDGRPTIRAARALSPEVYRTAAAKLDFPEPNADLSARMLCTPPDVIEEVLAHRTAVAKEVAAQLTEHVLRMLEARDTQMGYPK